MTDPSGPASDGEGENGVATGGAAAADGAAAGSDGPSDGDGPSGPVSDGDYPSDGDDPSGPVSDGDRPSSPVSDGDDPAPGTGEGGDGAGGEYADGRGGGGTADAGGDGDGVDHAWVMQTTFVLTMLLGVPVVAGAAAFADLPTWGARAEFAVRVGAAVWLLTGLLLYAYARVSDVGGTAARTEAAARGDADPEEG